MGFEPIKPDWKSRSLPLTYTRFFFNLNFGLFESTKYQIPLPGVPGCSGLCLLAGWQGRGALCNYSEGNRGAVGASRTQKSDFVEVDIPEDQASTPSRVFGIGTRRAPSLKKSTTRPTPLLHLILVAVVLPRPSSGAVT